MIKIISDMIKPLSLVTLLALPLFTSCASVEPGTVNDPGQALDAPTDTKADSDAYSEGLQNPEEQDNQDE
ncbi:MAG TPA: hypothetical protein VJV40_04345 [Thermodesulfobacteriota bacterium]|nr:hypothetical protein [Thermodesulfobacteriota bacterium]